MHHRDDSLWLLSYQSLFSVVIETNLWSRGRDDALITHVVRVNAPSV